ncbi:MAG: helix-turn-helix domain-containing protein [Pelotomaculum sp.]|nr:helix-turn-helix domain-containing protein [Pelotomaculum sp.]
MIENTDVYNYVEKQLKTYSCFCPAILPPAKILALSRIVANLTAEAIAKELNVSRSYIAQIEAGTRPLPRQWSVKMITLIDKIYKKQTPPEFQRWLECVFSLLTLSPKILEMLKITNDFSSEYKKFYAIGPVLDIISETVFKLEGLIRSKGLDALEYIENLNYTYLSFVLPQKIPDIVEVTWDNLPVNSSSELIKTMIDFLPEGRIPKRIITESPFLAWIAGVGSLEEMQPQKKKIYLLADIKNGFIRKDPSILAGLTVFFFDQIICNIAVKLIRPVIVTGITSDNKEITPLFIIKSNSTR